MAWLGLTEMSAATIARMRESAARRRAEAEAAQERADARIVSRAERLWRTALPDVTDTPVARYCAARGVPLAEIPNLEWSDLLAPEPRMVARPASRWRRRGDRGAAVSRDGLGDPTTAPASSARSIAPSSAQMA